MSKKAFTLLEALLVVIVIGILGTLAIPQYTRHKERAVDKEAVAGLKLIDGAVRIKNVELGGELNNNFNSFVCANTNECNDVLTMQLSDKNWNFKVEVGGAFAVGAYATRKNWPAGYNRQWSLDPGTSLEPTCSGIGGGQCP